MPGFAGTMREWKHGKLHSGSKRGPVVRSRKQALAIAFSEARKAGESVPRTAGRRAAAAMMKAKHRRRR